MEVPELLERALRTYSNGHRHLVSADIVGRAIIGTFCVNSTDGKADAVTNRDARACVAQATYSLVGYLIDRHLLDIGRFQTHDFFEMLDGNSRRGRTFKTKEKREEPLGLNSQFEGIVTLDKYKVQFTMFRAMLDFDLGRRFVGRAYFGFNL